MTKPIKTLVGCNQTHLCNLVTDAKCKLIPEKVKKLQAIPSHLIEVMRFPGGDADYIPGQLGHSKKEAKSSKWQRCKVDPMYVFIELSKIMKWKVLIVLNMDTPFTKYSKDEYFIEDIDANELMVKKFIQSGIPIAGVEIGNELQIYTGVTGDYNKNSSAYNKAIDDYLFLTELMDTHIKAIDKNIKTGACYVTPQAAAANGRDRRWQQVFTKTSCNALIVHHYEENQSESIWLPKLKDMAEYIHLLGKEAWLTENMWNFGPGTNSPKYSASMKIAPVWQKYKDNWSDRVTAAGFEIACMHRIAGNDNHPYDLIQL